MNQLFYFGCWGSQIGHYLFRESGATAYEDQKKQPFRYLDATHCPGGCKDPKQDQGDAAIVHQDGWTYVSLWDRTVDHRGNSNSGFLAEGQYSFDEMMAAAWTRYPDVMNRLALAGGVRLVAPEKK